MSRSRSSWSTGVKVRVVRPTISQVRSKTEPAAAND